MEQVRWVVDSTQNFLDSRDISQKQAISAVLGVCTLVYLYRRFFGNAKPSDNFQTHPLKAKYLENLQYVGKHPDEIGLDEIDPTIAEMRRVYRSNITRPISNRKKQLNAILRLLTENEKALLDALNEDLGRKGLLAIAYDILPCVSEARKMLKNIDKWSKPQRIPLSLLTFPSSEYHYPEPYGTVFVNGIWNFPIILSIQPILGAIAAGNNVVFSPCNQVPHVAELLGNLFAKYVDPRFVQVVGTPKGIPDDRACTARILKETNKFDLIFFTGSTNGGKYIMQQAAKTLTPVILELGGKNAVFVDETANLGLAARQMMFGRAVNCGQQCISPDYVLAHKDICDKLIDKLKSVSESFFEDDYKSDSGQSFLVNDAQFQRVSGMLNETNGKIIYGGGCDALTRRFQPTIVKVGLDDPSMEQETFGPILWVIEVDSMEDAIEYVNGRDKSLSLYIYSENSRMREHIARNTSSGAVQINANCLYAANKGLFGGVGASGIGGYHGVHSFRAFTHFKQVSRMIVEQKLAYPPWNGSAAEWKIWLMRKLL